MDHQHLRLDDNPVRSAPGHRLDEEPRCRARPGEDHQQLDDTSRHRHREDLPVDHRHLRPTSKANPENADACTRSEPGRGGATQEINALHFRARPVKSCTRHRAAPINLAIITAEKQPLQLERPAPLQIVFTYKKHPIAPPLHFAILRTANHKRSSVHCGQTFDLPPLRVKPPGHRHHQGQQLDRPNHQQAHGTKAKASTRQAQSQPPASTATPCRSRCHRHQRVQPVVPLATAATWCSSSTSPTTSRHTAPRPRRRPGRHKASHPPAPPPRAAARTTATSECSRAAAARSPSSPQLQKATKRKERIDKYEFSLLFSLFCSDCSDFVLTLF